MKKAFMNSRKPSAVIILIAATGEESPETKTDSDLRKSKIAKDLEHIDVDLMHAEIGLPKEDIVFAFSRSDGPTETESKKHMPIISCTVARYPLGKRCIKLLEYLADNPILVQNVSRKNRQSLSEAYCDIIRHVARGIYSSEKYILEKLNGKKHRKLVSLLYGNSQKGSLEKKSALRDLATEREAFKEWVKQRT